MLNGQIKMLMKPTLKGCSQAVLQTAGSEGGACGLNEDPGMPSQLDSPTRKMRREQEEARFAAQNG